MQLPHRLIDCGNFAISSVNETSLSLRISHARQVGSCSLACVSFRSFESFFFSTKLNRIKNVHLTEFASVVKKTTTVWVNIKQVFLLHCLFSLFLSSIFSLFSAFFVDKCQSLCCINQINKIVSFQITIWPKNKMEWYMTKHWLAVNDYYLHDKKLIQFWRI